MDITGYHDDVLELLMPERPHVDSHTKVDCPTPSEDIANEL